MKKSSKQIENTSCTKCSETDHAKHSIAKRNIFSIKYDNSFPQEIIRLLKLRDKLSEEVCLNTISSITENQHISDDIDEFDDINNLFVLRRNSVQSLINALDNINQAITYHRLAEEQLSTM